MDSLGKIVKLKSVHQNVFECVSYERAELELHSTGVRLNECLYFHSAHSSFFIIVNL